MISCAECNGAYLMKKTSLGGIMPSATLWRDFDTALEITASVCDRELIIWMLEWEEIGKKTPPTGICTFFVNTEVYFLDWERNRDYSITTKSCRPTHTSRRHPKAFPECSIDFAFSTRATKSRFYSKVQDVEAPNCTTNMHFLRASKEKDVTLRTFIFCRVFLVQF